MRLIIPFVLLASPALAADQPYSLADIVAICHQHEHLEQTTDEGSPTTKVVQNKGFEHCGDLYEWYAKAMNSPAHTAGDRIAVDSMWKMLGPAPKSAESTHVK